jgi:hypothetical protein
VHEEASAVFSEALSAAGTIDVDELGFVPLSKAGAEMLFATQNCCDSLQTYPAQLCRAAVGHRVVP